MLKSYFKRLKKIKKERVRFSFLHFTFLLWRNYSARNCFAMSLRPKIDDFFFLKERGGQFIVLCIQKTNLTTFFNKKKKNWTSWEFRKKKKKLAHLMRNVCLRYSCCSSIICWSNESCTGFTIDGIDIEGRTEGFIKDGADWDTLLLLTTFRGFTWFTAEDELARLGDWRLSAGKGKLVDWWWEKKGDKGDSSLWKHPKVK